MFTRPPDEDQGTLATLPAHDVHRGLVYSARLDTETIGCIVICELYGRKKNPGDPFNGSPGRVNYKEAARGLSESGVSTLTDQPPG